MSVDILSKGLIKPLWACFSIIDAFVWFKERSNEKFTYLSQTSTFGKLGCFCMQEKSHNAAFLFRPDITFGDCGIKLD